MYKTIEDCRVELVAHTSFPSDGVWEGGWDHSDWLPVSAARASFGKEDAAGDDKAKDRKLLKFLADNRHVSVFEHNYATFLVECPLFVRSQIMRHTSFRYNEISRRYTSENIEFWLPDKYRKQSASNKQASTDEEVDDTFLFNGEDFSPSDIASYMVHWCKWTYDKMLELGVCREQARSVLPQSLITRFYMTGNLRSWWSFLTSRLKEDTQYETRVIAQRIEKQLRELWPESMNALMGVTE